MSDVDMTIMQLCKKGYGSLAELNDLDTPEFLDLVEFESIINDIEQHHIDGA